MHVRSNELGSIDSEIRDINLRLEDKDKEHPLEKKERDALIFRLGMLTVQRVEAQRAYEQRGHRLARILRRVACEPRQQPALSPFFRTTSRSAPVAAKHL